MITTVLWMSTLHHFSLSPGLARVVSSQSKTHDSTLLPDEEKRAQFDGRHGRHHWHHRRAVLGERHLWLRTEFYRHWGIQNSVQNGPIEPKVCHTIKIVHIHIIEESFYSFFSLLWSLFNIYYTLIHSNVLNIFILVFISVDWCPVCIYLFMYLHQLCSPE